MARSRAKKSAEQKEAERLNNKIAMRKSRIAHSEEMREASKVKDTVARKGARAGQSLAVHDSFVCKVLSAPEGPSGRFMGTHTDSSRLGFVGVPLDNCHCGAGWH